MAEFGIGGIEGLLSHTTPPRKVYLLRPDCFFRMTTAFDIVTFMPLKVDQIGDVNVSDDSYEKISGGFVHSGYA